MVKNKTGGSGHRKMASKNANNSSKMAMRFAKDKDETYARVTELYGNGMAKVICSDKKTRLLQIRKKFRGRNKRDNCIALDSIVLVGLRSWEALSEKKKEKVDLLYVYSDTQYDELTQIAEVDAVLPESQQTYKEAGGFVIGDVETWEKHQEELTIEQEKDKEKDIKNHIVQDISAVGMNPLEDDDFAWNDEEEEEDWINDI